MIDDDSNPMQDILTTLQSSLSDTLLHPKCVKKHYRRAFLLSAVRLYNKQCPQ